MFIPDPTIFGIPDPDPTIFGIPDPDPTVFYPGSYKKEKGKIKLTFLMQE
jgi:hypothetical protein